MTALTRKQATFHYGWVLVITGVAVLFSCIGLGRFSLGILLPAMGASLGLTYSQMGFISTGNFIGYLAAVVPAGIVAKRIGARATIAMGLFLVGGSMALISVARNYRNTPTEKGLSPLGKDPVSSGPMSIPDACGSELHRGILIHLGFIFALFCAIQVVYATFIVTVMVNERGFGDPSAGSFWAVVGAFSIFSGQLFGWLSDRLGRRVGMMMVFVLFMLTFALAAADLPTPFLFISIAMFGLSMWSIPTIMYAAVGDYLGPARAAKAIGFITLFGGAGQVVGPAVAGAMADAAGTFQIVFRLCAVLSAGAACLVFFLRPRKREVLNEPEG